MDARIRLRSQKFMYDRFHNMATIITITVNCHSRTVFVPLQRYFSTKNVGILFTLVICANGDKN